MPIGTLQARIIPLDATKVRYGSNDPVSGDIILTFIPNDKDPAKTTAELFGPLKVQIVLNGSSNIRMWRKLRNSYTYSRSQQALFSITSTVYDEPFKCQAGKSHQFPFLIFFPESVDSASLSGWNQSERYPTETARTLPPTFSDKPSGVQGRLESFVEYRLGITVDMPGLKVIICKPEKDEAPVVLYERPRLSQPVETARHEVSWNLNEKSFGHTVRNAFLACEGPRHLYCGQPAIFKVRLEIPLVFIRATYAFSNIRLIAFGVKLKATTAVRGKTKFLTKPQMSVQSTVATPTCMVDSATPFAASGSWIKRAIAGKISVPSTFNSMNISRLYHIEVKLVLECDGKPAQRFSASYGVVVHPPLDSSTASAGALDRATGTSVVPAILPEYERPPEYEAAAAA